MNQPNAKAPRPKKMPLLAIVLLGLVVLACETPAPAPPSLVCVVEADPTINGKAYAQVELSQYGPDYQDCSRVRSVANNVPTVYETDDYGQSWHQTNPALLPGNWQLWRIPHNIPDLAAHDGRLWFNNRAILVTTRPPLHWLFPGTLDPFESGAMLMSSVAPPGQGVLYVAMGSYGMLVGPNPAEASDRAWHWARNEFGLYIAPSDFPPASVTDLGETLRIIFILLVIPPLPWFNAWLLAQAWRYMFPPDESRKSMRLAWMVSFINTMVYAVAISIWLRDMNTDFSAMMGGAGIFTTILSVVVGVSVGRRRQFTDSFIRRLMLTTGLLSLMVPISIVAAPNQFGWPILLSVVFGFIIYRRALVRYLDRLEARATMWQIDRLVLEIMGLLLVMFIPLVLGAALLFRDAPYFLVILLVVPLLGSSIMSAYTKWRGRNFVIKKKASPLELHDTPLFADQKWADMVIGQTGWWFGSTLVVSIVVLAGQQLFLIR